MKSINPKDVHKALQKNPHQTLLIDVRSEGEYSFKNIPGAKNIPLEKIHEFADDLRKYDEVYIHCQSGNRSSKACKQLQDLGLENVVNVEGGITIWEQLDLPIQKKKGTLPIMRQVLLVAGLLILISGALSLFVHDNWIWLGIAVGCGLTFAGATGNCMMSKLLLKMPWNK